MSDIMYYLLVPLAVLVVAAVLLLGLLNFARGGSPQTSQKLMRMRVFFQLIAIVVIMLAIWIMGR
jgi:hypothetical protein